jgi:hypothetical protein
MQYLYHVLSLREPVFIRPAELGGIQQVFFINEQLGVMHPEFGTKPNVQYIGLPKRFVAGTVLFGDKNECAENATVKLIGDKEKKTAKTDNYGDFEFEGLPADASYVLKVEYPRYKTQEFKVNTKVDVYLGEIILR